MAKPAALFPILLLSGVAGLTTTGCMANAPLASMPEHPPLPAPVTPEVAQMDEVLANQFVPQLLQESWTAYKQRFIQADGRVIDWEADARTVSEGQAYAMLRAVLIDDPVTFEKTLLWAENNLRRKLGNRPKDTLWAWLWGKDAGNNWGIQDANFASDADVDAITALIFAARRWNRPDYLTLARTKLRDLWKLSTIEVQGKRYFLPGPAIAFQPQPNQIKLNPSYLAPASFRLFAQVDPEHDWQSLVTGSYEVLEESARLSAVGLPSDWVILDTTTKRYLPVQGSVLETVYSFDAYRVWWRVALDAVWFDAPEAKAFLQNHLSFLEDKWQANQRIPARFDLQGNALVDYEAIAQYAMLYAGFAPISPSSANEILQQKLLPAQQDGIWENLDAYYVQNLAWLGLSAPIQPEKLFLQSK